MKVAHIAATVLALVFVFAGVEFFDWYVRSLEDRNVRALALEDFDQKNVGSSLQRVAFQHAGILVLYGSSEVELSGVFDKYATGFDVFRLGGGGSDDLVYLQELASVGDELRGKKVVISFAPGQFWYSDGITPQYYAGYFSRLHAYETAFSTDLSMDLKQAVARRMLQFPDTLSNDALLNFALEKLADGSPQSLALYYLVFPLGKFQTFVLNLQDDWEMWNFFQHEPNLNAPHRTTAVNWSTLIPQAEAKAVAVSSSNPFGFEDTYWKTDGASLTKLKATESDNSFRQYMTQTPEWGDLELLLRTLQEMGAHTLILSTPMPGTYYDYLGISSAGRQAYYARLEALCKEYGAQLEDFSDHDLDKYFVKDRWSHPSVLGGIYYQEALNQFYFEPWKNVTFSLLPPH